MSHCNWCDWDRIQSLACNTVQPAILAFMSHPNYYPNMDDIRISLSGSTKAFVDAEVADGSYASVIECVDDILRAGTKAKAQEKLDALLLEGLESGDGEPWTDDDWEALKRRVREA